MVVRKRKKKSRMQGSHTHGWGCKKRHRGAGARSGRGNAGRGKRSAHKKPWFHKQHIFLGHVGFTMHGQTYAAEAVNLETIQANLEKYVESGLAEKKGDVYVLDTAKIGYSKVLGSGVLHSKLHITARAFSENAKEKIKNAGGEAIEQE